MMFGTIMVLLQYGARDTHTYTAVLAAPANTRHTHKSVRVAAYTKRHSTGSGAWQPAKEMAQDYSHI
jgi:hypothetical protein